MPPIGSWGPTFRNNGYPPATNGGSLTSADGATGPWLMHLLPFVEQDNLYKQFSTLGNLSTNDPSSSYFVAYDALISSPVKLFLCPADGSTTNGLQLHGGYGYMNEFPIARMFRDARVERIYGGTNEIMKVLIARTL